MLALRVAGAELGEGGALVAVDGDEEALGVEAVHLDEPVVVGDGAVDDEEDEVVVVVDLRALAEVLGVLDRERVELEDVAEDLEVVAVGLVEVEPEELPAREQLLDGLAAEVHLAAALVVDDVADRRPVRSGVSVSFWASSLATLARSYPSALAATLPPADYDSPTDAALLLRGAAASAQAPRAEP